MDPIVAIVQRRGQELIRLWALLARETAPLSGKMAQRWLNVEEGWRREIAFAMINFFPLPPYSDDGDDDANFG